MSAQSIGGNSELNTSDVNLFAIAGQSLPILTDESLGPRPTMEPLRLAFDRVEELMATSSWARASSGGAGVSFCSLMVMMNYLWLVEQRMGRIWVYECLRENKRGANFMRTPEHGARSIKDLLDVLILKDIHMYLGTYRILILKDRDFDSQR